MPEDFPNEAPPRAVALSAESAEELAALCGIAARAPFSYDFHKFTPHDAARAKFRRAAVASDEAEAAKILLTPIEQACAPKKLAFAFPGQGAAGASRGFSKKGGTIPRWRNISPFSPTARR